MANPNRTALAPLVTFDGAWLRCRECPEAFWGIANVTAVVVAKAQRHAHKAHAALGGRPQRRGAVAAVDADMGVEALTALASALAVHAQDVLARLGNGIARTGYRIPGDRVMLKVARSTDTRKHNLAEAQSWATAPADKREWLCPVIACAPDGSWLLMRYAERVGHCGWRVADEVQDALGAFVGDLHDGNIGIVDGHPVATDYADGFRGKPIDWVNGRR